MRQAFATKNWAQAKSLLEGKNALYKDSKDQLLLLMERGHIAHGQGNWQESSQFFKDALDLHDKLFTVSVSGKVAKTIVNDQSDIYYGETYEIATLHLLQTINHLMLYASSHSRDDLFRARAQVFAWNKFLEEYQRDSEVAPVFKADLMAKLLGASVHELLNSRTDNQIALDLYVQAREILLRNYGAYASFNTKAKSFVADYEKFPKLGLDQVVKNYIQPTPLQTNLQQKIEGKIISLARSVRSTRLPTYLKFFGKSEKDFPKKQKSNVKVILSLGQAPLKTAETQYIGLTAALEDPEASSGAKFLAGVSSVALTLFAADKLGLMPPPNSWNPAGSQLGLQMSFAAATSGASIKFQLPEVKAAPITSTYQVVVLDEAGKEVATSNAEVVQPIGEIAAQAVAEKAVARYWRVGVRLALKHAAAIAASFATYKALRGSKNDNDFLARNAAVFQYLAAAKGIEHSESADTRAWATLPDSFSWASFHLKPGKYQFVLHETPAGGAVKMTQIGSWEISSEPKLFYSRL